MNHSKSWLVVMLGFLVILQGSLSSTQIVHAAELVMTSLQNTKSLSSEQRYDAYMDMTMNTQGWQAGMIVSEIPYAVVTDKVDVYKLKVFTGVIHRNSDDLVVEWDDIWINTDGDIQLAA